jgi:prepilin-type N-terminal cleavage/methylation domain-containing protein
MRVRGFTLVELLTVIAVIAVFVGIAIPLSVNVRRDQRVNNAAMRVAEVFRQARTRALGRGTAVLVRWTESGGTSSRGLLEVHEATFDVDANGGLIPNTSACIGTDWSAGSVQNALVTSFDLGAGPFDYAAMNLTFPDEATDVATFDICFTPHGRTWSRVDPAGAFQQLTGVPTMLVKNTSTQSTRRVFLPPTGDARIQL